MKCKECGKVFDKKDNQAVRISGEKITVCPNCGHEEVMKQKKNSKWNGDFTINKSVHQSVKEYLENVKSGAKVMDDIEMMHRVDRALAAFDADVEDEIFNDDFKEKFYDDWFYSYSCVKKCGLV